MPFLAVFDQTSSKLKICSRNVLKMIKTSFESLGSIFFEKINFENFLHFFVPFCNQNGNIQKWKTRKSNNTVLVTNKHKKVQKISKSIFSKNMDHKLSNDVFIMSKTFLEQILRSDEVWSKTAKNAIFAIFCDFRSSYFTP